MTNKLWDEDRKALRELLKELRKHKAGLTQIELSRMLGRPQSYVSKYEIGERNLDYIEVIELCKALDISPEEFNTLFEQRTQGRME